MLPRKVEVVVVTVHHRPPVGLGHRLAGGGSGLARVVAPLGPFEPEAFADLGLDSLGEVHAELHTVQQPRLDVVGNQVGGRLVVASLEELNGRLLDVNRGLNGPILHRHQLIGMQI